MSPLTVLLKNRVRLIGNWRRILREQSRFKTGFILLFAIGLTASLQMFFARGFRVIDTLGQAGAVILPRLFALFFLGMALMLVVSGAITAYTTLFRSAEMNFLRVHPVRRGDLTVIKAIESASLASWAFFFVIIPFTIAYARHQGLPPVFTLWTLFMSVPFLMLCAGIGVLITLLVCRFMPRRIGWPLLAALAIMIIAIGLRMILYRSESAVDETLFVLGRLVPGFRLAANRFLPPYWMAEGILGFSRGHWARGLLFWGLLTSYALMLGLLIERPGGRWFDAAWQRTRVAAAGRRHRGPVRPAVRWTRCLAGFSSATRAMIVKDIRTFCRDPAQWSQGLIFFGLLALYFSNLRTLRYHFLPDAWRSAIAFLNMFSLATVLCSLSSRFVFPQLSLEGQAFWLLGLAPVARGRILAAKVATALTATLLVSLTLMLISSGMLSVAPAVRWISLGIGAATACAFTGLSVGLGAVFMDLRQPNTSAIVSGFGGTLNLALSLAFMVAAILPFVLIQRFQADLREAWGWHAPLAGAWIWLILITAATTAIPLWLGYRSLQNREY